eukprot:3113805-Rhodomonas_salina.1
MSPNDRSAPPPSAPSIELLDANRGCPPKRSVRTERPLPSVREPGTGDRSLWMAWSSSSLDLPR